ncbi:ATP synthase subunit I [Pleurocapsa sp. PCC 7319]|uniref:ATP synthase subunit I n=1 Tax=Pleurocapsa sp. PCC 7319 TaxID=118161 RepID=UPI00034D0938|nr:ATP synthase subunit I [Pleurocapsa sp. PCC 7319]
MSKARPSWQQIFSTLNLLIKDKKLRKYRRWAVYCFVFALMWWFNWKLLLATSVGIGLMSLNYLLQNSHWQRYYQQWQSFLSGSNSQMILAVSTGATGAFCTYLAASVWTDTDNQWLATGAILQVFTSMTTLALLWWSLSQRNDNSLESKLDQLLADLSHSDALKRLIAIRQLTRLLVTHRLSSEYYQQSIEYYHLMLSQPQAPMVKNALFESLDILEGEKLFRAKRPPVKIPIKLELSQRPLLDNLFRDQI